MVEIAKRPVNPAFSSSPASSCRSRRRGGSSLPSGASGPSGRSLFVRHLSLSHAGTGGVVSYLQDDPPRGTGLLDDDEGEETTCRRPHRVYGAALTILVKDAGAIRLPRLHHRQVEDHLPPSVLDPEAPFFVVIEGVDELFGGQPRPPADLLDVFFCEVDQVALLHELRLPLGRDQVLELLRSAMMTTGPTPLAPKTGRSEGGPDLHSKRQENRLKNKKKKKGF